MADAQAARLVGIGVQVSKLDESAPVVISNLVEGSVADRAGLQVGDQVLSLDGMDCALLTANQAAGVLMGPVGSKIRLKVWNAASEERVVELIRGGTEEALSPRYDFHKHRRAVSRTADSALSTTMLSTGLGDMSFHDKSRSALLGLWECEVHLLERGRLQQEDVHRHVANLHDHYSSEVVNKGLNMTVDMYNKNLMHEDKIRRLEAELDLTKKLLFEAQQEQQETLGRLELAKNDAPGDVSFQWMQRDRDSREEAVASSIQKMTKELKEASRSPDAVPSQPQSMERVRSASSTRTDKTGAARAPAPHAWQDDFDPVMAEQSVRNQIERLTSGATAATTTVSIREDVVVEMLQDMAKQEQLIERLKSGQADDTTGLDEKDDIIRKLQAEIEHQAYLQEMCEERGRTVLQLHAQLEQAQALIKDVKSRYDHLLVETGAMRDQVGLEKDVNTNKDELIAMLQHQVEQMQLLALQQSRDAERSLQAVGEMKSTVGNQESEIIRLNEYIRDLEDRHKKQMAHVDEASARWKAKRDDALSQLEQAKEDVARRDEIIGKHTKLISEYQQVLDVLKNAGGPSQAFKPVRVKKDNDEG